MNSIIFYLAAYLVGSVNFSLLLARLAGRGDLRKLGSGNPGVSNVYRVMGKPWAFCVLALDLARGWLVGLCALVLLDPGFEFILGGISAICGNLFPVFHRFRGGKGIAMALGIYLALSLWLALACMGIWIGLVFWTGRASIGSLTVMVVFPLVILLLGYPTGQIIFSALLLAITGVTHRQNIVRLVKGEESPIRP